jgi:hypothetical protein
MHCLTGVRLNGPRPIGPEFGPDRPSLTAAGNFSVLIVVSDKDAGGDSLADALK